MTFEYFKFGHIMKNFLTFLISSGLLAFYIQSQHKKIEKFREICNEFLRTPIPKIPGENEASSPLGYVNTLLNPTNTLIKDLNTYNAFIFLSSKSCSIFREFQMLRIEESKYRLSNRGAGLKDSTINIILLSSTQKIYRNFEMYLKQNLNQSNLIIWAKGFFNKYTGDLLFL